jgi:hypothetical protein
MRQVQSDSHLQDIAPSAARRCGSLELRRMDLVGNRGTFEGQACQNETIDVVRGDRP